MTAKKAKMVVGVFRDRNDSEEAFEYLRSRGYVDSEINVLMSDRTRQNIAADEDTDSEVATDRMTEGVGVGSAVGTAVGATLAAIAAIGTSLVLPGIGLVIAGPLAAALAGGGAGAITGGLLGGIVGSEMPQQNSNVYVDALRNGGIVIGVTPHDDAQASEIETKFKALHGANVGVC